MDLSDIKLIKAIHDAGSISRASANLFMSQPTLSKKLARLEDQLGAELFVRYPKGLVATQTAKYIISQYPNLRRQLAEIDRHIDLMKNLDGGLIRIGVGPIIEQVLIPHVITSFFKSTGNSKLSLVTEDDETLLHMLAESEIDLAVGPFTSEQSEKLNVETIPMLEDRIVGVTRANHPIAKSTALIPEKLKEYPWIAPKVQGSVRPEGDSPLIGEFKLTSDNYDLLKRITKNSDSICAGPLSVFKADLADGSLVELPIELNVNWSSVLLVRPETVATPLVEHVVNLFREACESY